MKQTSEKKPVPDWSIADEGLVREAYRLGEAQLSAQLQLAIAADQRSAVLAGFFGATSTGVIAAIATAGEFRTNLPLLLGAAYAAAMFFFAALWCILALLPTKLWTPGNKPSEWYSDISAKSALIEALGQQADFYDQNICDNNIVLEKNAGWLLLGALYGVGAPFGGVIATVVFKILSH